MESLPPPEALEPAPETAVLPLPPPESAGEDDQPQRTPRPGELTAGWATMFWIVWAGVAAAFAAVWVSSRTTGLSTWWLGPESDPRSVLLNLLPFAAPLGLAAAAFARLRWLPWAGVAGAAVQAAIGLGDVGRVDKYALVELAIVGGALAVSLASFSGLLRKPLG